ncbi:MAG: pilin, partial [Candidatus Uhrbacteria bacterium]
MFEFLNKKKRFNIIATIGVVAIFVAVFFVPEALAQTDFEQFSDSVRLGQADIRYIIASIIRYAIALVGVVFLGLIVYGGFLFMTSKGEPDKITKAKDVLKNGVIGLAIILASYAIVSFIISVLLRAGLLGEIGSSPQPGIEVLSGSLGSGIIEDHWPLRNATDIARNTNIMITFKEAIKIESFADMANQITGADTVDPSDDSWYINVDFLKIYPILDGVEAALPSEGVVAATTWDQKIWVFNPVEYLGSSLEEVDYSVALLPGITLEDGTQAFTGFNDEGYVWSFEVSTEIDSTPPYITSVGPPDESTRDRNIVVQINFSEAVDPTSSTGVYIAGDETPDFTNILVQESALQDTYTTVDGTWMISNGYKTVEFVTFDSCGEDPCGDTIYCLPGNSYILTEASAATLSDEPPMAAGFPYDGVVDTCANSLDGDADGIAEGPEIDSYDWEFYTTNEVNDIVPIIYKIEPDEDAEE